MSEIIPFRDYRREIARLKAREKVLLAILASYRVDGQTVERMINVALEGK